MRNIINMDGIQIDITNHCVKQCGNCTRYCALVKDPYYMPLEDVKRAIDSTIGYPSFTGIMGGEPLLHPDFDEICRYALDKRPDQTNATNKSGVRHKIQGKDGKRVEITSSRQLGLWTTLPKGYEHHAKRICETFYHCYINDHSIPNIYHWPSLVAVQEVEPNRNKMWNMINDCWVQHSWCASINPRGAWFCEVAANMAMLWGEGEGWPVEPGWWWRTPKDYIEQMETWCPRCGMPAPLALRASVDKIDDVSPKNYEELKDRVRHHERFKVHDLRIVGHQEEKMAAYKDFDYRNRCAAKYGMFLVINECNTWTPYMKGDTAFEIKKSIFDNIKERFAA